MTLQPSLFQGKRKLAVKLERAFVSEPPPHFLVIGVSGGGKTSSLTDLANDFFIMYHECGVGSEKRRVSRIGDLTYVEMIQSFRKKANSQIYDPNTVPLIEDSPMFRTNRQIAQQVATVDFLCRYAELFKLIELTDGKLTCREYYFHQYLTRGRWIKKLRSFVEDLSPACCHELLDQMAKKISSVLKPSDLIVVFDDIEIDCSSLDTKANARGFLFEHIKALEVLTFVCGFKMVYISAFDRSGTIKIAIGKDKALKSIVMDSYEDFDEEKADAEDEIEQEDVDEEEKTIFQPSKRFQRIQEIICSCKFGSSKTIIEQVKFIRL